MDDFLNIGNISDALALHVVNYSPDTLTVKQVKEIVGAACCAVSEYCSENGIKNDVFAI